jgi:GDP-4-dehydro-6-deoxy-D-mannose reductase
MRQPAALVTGADGFVGQHLVALLQDAGMAVHGVVRGEAPLLRTLSAGRAAGVCWHTGVELADASRLRQIAAETLPELVFHLAGVALPSEARREAEQALATNAGGTANLLTALAAGRLLRSDYDPAVLVTGSVAAYGRTAERGTPLRESDPLDPADAYAASKAAQEEVARAYAREEGLRVVVTRPFHHTGPGQVPPYVIPDWANQLRRIRAGELEPVLRVGDIAMERDFLDVRDVVRAYFELAQRASGFEIYNVCSGRAVPLSHLLDLLQRVYEVKVRVVVDEERLRPGEARRYVGSAARLRAHTGWEPRLPLIQTLRDLARSLEAGDPAHVAAPAA